MSTVKNNAVRTGLASLDERTGGLPAGRGHLVYGEVGTGKSSFGLRFLQEGLKNNEVGVLVTRSHPEVVFEQARALDFDLESAVRRGNVLLLEYADRVLENVARAKSDAEIVSELVGELGSRPVKRLVFDPVTPLLAGSSDAAAGFKVRSLVHRFSQLDATTLYVLDLPEAAGLVTGFRDAAQAVLRIENAAHGRGLVAERLAGVAGSAARFSLGDAEAPVPRPVAVEAVSGTAAVEERRRVLIIDPDKVQRSRLRSLLQDHYALELAEDAATGLVDMATQPPDLVIVEKECGSVDGVELCRRLRAKGHNLPIILLSGTIRRQRDRIAAIAAGADECLEKPLDGRLLKLKVENLLRRYDGRRDRMAPARGESVVMDAGYAVTTTDDVDYFFGRLRESVDQSFHQGVPFAVAFVKSSWAKALPRMGPLLREYDLVCETEGMAAVLLAETAEPGVAAFARRLETATDAPLDLEYRCFDRPAVEDVIDFAARRLMPVEQQRVTG